MFLDESNINEVEYCRKVACWRRVACAITSLVNVRYMDMQPEYAVHPYSSDTIIWKKERSSSLLVGWLQNRLIHTVKDCFRKISFNIRQARRMMYDMDEWLGFVRGNT